MAVCATHLTLLHLGEYIFPGPVIDHQLCDGICFILTIPVVEFEDDRVAFATIHAWVLQQIFVNPLCFFFPESVSALAVFLFIQIVIGVISLLPVLVIALPTPGRFAVSRPLSGRECSLRLISFTSRTPLHAAYYIR